MTTALKPRADWAAIGAAELPGVVALRRAIHEDPELGNHCPRTTAKAKAALAGLPLEIHDSKQTTGFIAILRGVQGGDGGNARTVLLRGDMDALPMAEETGLPFASKIDGAMHACGHDAHTAMLVGAAKALAARKDQLNGAVVFMFQPGEEGFAGGKLMIEDGLLDIARPDAAFALHVWPNGATGKVLSRPGPLLAAVDMLHAVIKGKGGHAAMPHDNLDPIPVACEIVTALQTFVARRIPVHDPAVLSITKIAAGTTNNVIPAEVTMLGTLRTLSEETRSKMLEAFPRIVTHVAAAHGLIGEAWAEDNGYPATLNDPRAVDIMASAARELGGEGGYHAIPTPIMAGEDFAFVLREVPGAMAFLGVADPSLDPPTAAPLHNTRMTIDEDALARGVAMHCAIADRFLEHGLG